MFAVATDERLSRDAAIFGTRIWPVGGRKIGGGQRGGDGGQGGGAAGGRREEEERNQREIERQ